MTTKLLTKNVGHLNDKKAEFLDLAIDFAVLTLHSMCSEPTNNVHLKNFIRQMVAYSGTTYSTLLTSILYLFRLNSMKAECGLDYLNHFRQRDSTSSVTCSARLFLTSLIVAHKYLHDRITSVKAWSKLSNIPRLQLNMDEMEFLKIIKFRLFVTTITFEKWSTLLRNTVIGKEVSAPIPLEPVLLNNPHKINYLKLTKSKAKVMYHPYIRVQPQEYNQKVPSL
ncbi:PHO85 cyclin-5 [Basidiobolus ranarum]|uniref:PHO85 cyclin-5 n=1 Tax=Basidiobolus ranarum TaxID=34480 RepID=A0ABR2VXN1_9FUNG